MKRQKNGPRLLGYASIIALSLNACTQHGGKLDKEINLTDNDPAQSTSETKKSRVLPVTRNGGRWLKKKENSSVSSRAKVGKNGLRYDNLWERLFDLYNLPPIEHQAIDRELDWFLRHPDYIDRVQTRAEPFLYSIVRQVEKHDLPGEIALLPVIESAFQPHAVSPANAAGIWQFIPSTGRMYGLKQSRTYDGRRDIYASTRAAIKYLKKLHSDFNGDWLLAIAAYNCGEGAVGRAIQRNAARNLPTDFWSLDLPEETRAYVPRLLAVAKLFSESDQYGIDLHPIPNTALFKPVKVSNQLDLALAADAADISLEKLYELNPGFKTKHADLDGSYRLFIPADKKTKEFKAELARLAQERFSESSQKDPAESPEQRESLTLASIEAPVPMARTANLRTFGAEKDTGGFVAVSLTSGGRQMTGKTKERESRASGRSEDVSKPPSRILAKIRGESPAEAADEPRGKGKEPGGKKPSPQESAGKKAIYTAQAGDTLWSIARKNDVPLDQLLKWNGLTEKQGVKAGQALTLWNKDAARKLPAAGNGIRSSQSIKYKVRQGDTLFSISQRFKVSVADLRKWNGAQVEKQMQPGKNITVQMEKD